ncbi:hypothetical protein PV327_009178 [Microctonus hyperodae]|uniref:Uncharacterized protein n=1 Tax=Microctonus hyperodae TaxID=165561 RepID=A0AA39FT85_MICHY|nr:hypothetical protein PV327_009178 [Microctonus hyperodae]
MSKCLLAARRAKRNPWSYGHWKPKKGYPSAGMGAWYKERIRKRAMREKMTAIIEGEIVNENDSIIKDTVISILTLCYAEKLNSTVVISNDANNTNEYFDSFFLAVKLSSVIIINNNYTTQSDRYCNYTSKSNLFILTITSFNNLKSIMVTLKSTRWWNNEALFFVIGISTINANEVLKLMWKMNILSALFLYQFNDNVEIFTHNPFTNRAPYPWRQVNDVEKLNDHWNLYTQQYNENICGCFKFDKSQFLDGYKIHGIANAKGAKETNITYKEYKICNLIDTLEFEHAIYFRNIFEKLNVTIAVRYDEVGYWSDGKPMGFLKSLVDETSDIAMHSRAIRFSYNLTTTYPLRIGSSGILTQFRKTIPPYKKILRFYSIGVILLTILSLFMSFIVQLIYKKRGIASAFFEILRLILTNGFLRSINRQSVRIYFFGIFILILILNATFTSKLSAFLTQPERRYITTVDDLVEFDYDVYIPDYVAEKSFDWTQGKINKLKILSRDDCYYNVVNYVTSACVGPIAPMVPVAVKYRLYLSFSIINDEYLVYWTRHEWPLINRVDVISSKLMEGGFLAFWRQQALILPLKKLNITETNSTKAKYRPINIEDLIFAFCLLAIGLVCSIMSFIFEILINKCIS